MNTINSIFPDKNYKPSLITGHIDTLEEQW